MHTIARFILHFATSISLATSKFSQFRTFRACVLGFIEYETPSFPIANTTSFTAATPGTPRRYVTINSWENKNKKTKRKLERYIIISDVTLRWWVGFHKYKHNIKRMDDLFSWWYYHDSINFIVQLITGTLMRPCVEFQPNWWARTLVYYSWNVKWQVKAYLFLRIAYLLLRGKNKSCMDFQRKDY